jgi:hypothetical protein
VTWARVLEKGHGSVSFRLEIAGHPDEFVTHEDMERSDSFGVRARVALLNSTNVKLSERCTLVDAKTTGGGFTAKIVDVRGRATESFRTMATARTVLQAQPTANPGKFAYDATSMTVLGTEGFIEESGHLWIDGEVIGYDTKTATTFDGLTRGLFGTFARDHYYDPTGAEAREPEITNRPVTMEGRRAQLFAYGPGDDPAGNGTQIWRGVVSSQPRYNGTSYSILVDPITRLLKQTVGGILDVPVSIRGIYYSAEDPLVIHLEEGDSSSGNGKTATVARSFRFQLCGFWETQAEFLAAVQTELDARSGAFTSTLTAIEIGDSWGIHVLSPSSDPRYVFPGVLEQGTGLPLIDTEAPLISLKDGRFNSWLTPATIVDTVSPVVNVNSQHILRLRTHPLGDTSTLAPQGAGTVPRTCLGYTQRPGLSGWLSTERVNVDLQSFPATRLYLDATPNAGWQHVTCEWQANGAGVEQTVDTYVTALDDDFADRWVKLRKQVDGELGPVKPPLVATAANPPELEFLVQLTEGSVVDFITALVDDSRAYANLGIAPDLEPDDFDMTTPGALEVDAAAEGFLRRVFAFTGSQDLEEVLIEELKMCGAFLYTTSAGKMSFRPLRHATQVEKPGHEITPSRHVVGDNWLHFENMPLGVYNTIVIKTGYDPIEDEHLGREYIVRDKRAYGRTPIARTLEIAPMSRASRSIAYADVLEVVSRILGMFAGEYEILRVNVTPQLFGVLLGDVVSITSPKVPSTDGTKGIEEQRGIVVSREWSLMRDGGSGSLEILMTTKPLAGYSPAAIITSGSLTGGTTYELDLDDGDFPEGDTAADHFQAGDLIRVSGFGSGEVPVLGTVVSVDGSIVVVTLTGGFVFGGSDSFIAYQQPSAIPIDHATAGAQVQHAYGAIASATGIITYLGFEAPFRVFAP